MAHHGISTLVLCLAWIPFGGCIDGVAVGDWGTAAACGLAAMFMAGLGLTGLCRTDRPDPLD